MKYEFQIRTADFEYINGQTEGTAEDAVQAYRELQEAWKGGTGVGIKGLAKILHEYCTKGSIENGGNYEFSQNEKLLLGEVRKLMRNNNK